MKKIVAIVLSLVMVLGLATTAFAVDLWQTNESDATVDNFEAAENTKVAEGVTMTFYAAKAPKFDKATGAPVAAGNIAYYAAEMDQVAYMFVRVSSIPATGDVSDYFIVKPAAPVVEEGEYVEDNQTAAKGSYFMKLIDNPFYVYTGSVFTAWSDDCEAYAEPVDADDVKYYTNTIDKVAKIPAADETTGPDAGADVTLEATVLAAIDNIKVDDVTVVTLAVNADGVGYVYPTKHAWVSSDWDADGNPTHYTCDNCDTVGVVINSPYNNIPGNKIDKLGVDGEKGTLISYKMGTKAPAAGDKVESAQTFDAGIAMYVGMSVMAAAGSAVVLKKKD